MKEQLEKLRNSFTEFWKAQDKKRRILYISIAGGIVLLAVVLTLVLNIKKDVVLYTGLDSTEVGEIVQQIQEMGLTANLTADGTISVPEDQENKLRMQLGTMGYPKSGLDYNIWDSKIDLFSTDYQKRMVAKQQLETRLIDTIETLAGVERAIVTLDIPEQKNTVITVNRQEPTASVVLHLKNNVVLTDEQIIGITNIVLNSVSGMEEGGISITDGTGKIIAVGMGNQIDVVTEERNKLRFKHDLENGIKQEIYNMLIPAYTENGVRVAVNATLNYDKQVSEDVEYTPSHEDDGSGMLQHEDIKDGSGTVGADGGMVGVEPNADGTYPTGTEGDGGSWSESSSSRSWLVNTLKTQTEKSGYNIEQLTVSVMVYKEFLSDLERESIINTVAGAAGIDVDFVSVGNIPKFEDTLPVVGLGYPFGLSAIQFYVILGVILVLILIFTVLYISVSARQGEREESWKRHITKNSLHTRQREWLPWEHSSMCLWVKAFLRFRALPRLPRLKPRKLRSEGKSASSQNRALKLLLSC